MQALILALFLQAHALQDEHVSARTFPVTTPASVIVTRGYYEKKGSAWQEGHRNEIERGMYDERGLLIGIVEVGILDSIYKFRNATDSAGHVTETTITTGTSYYGREVLRYDQAGRKTEVEYFDRENDLQARVLYFYTKQGHLSRQDEFRMGKKGSKPALTRQTVYAYSKDGSQVRQTTYVVSPKKRVERVVLADERGHPVAETIYDRWGKVDKEFVYEYELAPQGFWTKQVKLKKLSETDSVPVDVLYRQLIYFPAK